MDELKQAWLNLDSADYTDHELKSEEIMQAIHAKSKNPVQKLAQNIYAKFWYVVLFVILEAAGIILIDIPLVQILLGIMLGAYMIGGVVLYMEYKDLKKGIPMDMNLLSSIRQYRDRVRKVLRYEEITALLIYPISLVAGFCLGSVAANPDAVFFDETKEFIAIGISLIVVVPLCYLLARWMNKKSFGKHLEELDNNIRRLENV